MSEKPGLRSYQFGSEMKFYERMIFQFRPALLILLLLTTAFFGYQATKVKLDTSFFKMIPTKHPFIENMMTNLDDIGAVGTVIQIAVETTEKDIFTKEYIETVKLISDETFYLPGVNRIGLQSIYTPNVRWTEVTEEGFEGGPVIPDGYDGSPEKLAELRVNILRSGRVGSLVADNFKSTIVQATLFDKDPATGEPLDYQKFSQELEQKIRDKYQSDKVKIHVIGVAKLIGDLTDAAPQIALFFLIAFVISFVLLIWYTRCIISTVALLTCAIISVIWQLGLLQTLGMPLSAYSSLVPFLVFAISISHGIQNVNANALSMAEGNDAFTAAQLSFSKLYVAGMTALLADVVGFLTLMIIDIPSIKDLAIAASIGIAVIIFTKLILLTILMSYFGVTKSGIRHFQKKSQTEPRIWGKVSLFATPKYAAVSIVIAVLMTLAGFFTYGEKLKFGDLDEGAPELRPDSRYNLDSKFIADNYTVSSDIFLIMIKTAPDKCVTHENLEVIDRFGWTMENVEGVQSSVSLTYVVRQVLAGFSEGNLKWSTIPRNQQAIDSTVFQIPPELMNSSCSYAPLILFLADHKAETLQRVVAAAEKFIQENPKKDLEFLLATGNAGIEAATNDVIIESYYPMILWVYLVVGLLVLITFNSIRATVCIILPLVVTSILCDSLMAFLGIGVKVATLPVVALGVGIGVDYSIYLYAKMESYLQEGNTLPEAYYNTLKTTGNAIVLTAVTLAIGVITWAWSPIKFQADMGILLTFMFLWNMVGAVWLMPALCCFLIKPEKVIARRNKKQNKKKAALEKVAKPAT
jgi:predicted RND superfamily exporter protein